MKTQPIPGVRGLKPCPLKPFTLATTRLLLAVLFCLLPPLTRAETGVEAWAQRYNGPGNSYDYAYAVAVDRSNNVIVTGGSTGSGGDSDFATIKYVCVPSPLMTSLNQTNGLFQVRVDNSLQPGTFVIEASTNLTDWVPVFTNNTPTNVLLYDDPDAGVFPQRFYRAFQFP
jgi:hypothetical protein